MGVDVNRKLFTMNKIYQDTTSCDHEELRDIENNSDVLGHRKSNNSANEQLTALVLIDSLKLHVSTARLCDSILVGLTVH